MLIDYCAAIFEIDYEQTVILHNFSYYWKRYFREIMAVFKNNVYIQNFLYFYDMMAIDRIYFTISLLCPIFGALALTMTLKLTLDTDTM